MEQDYLEILKEGMETIEIPASFRGKSYQIPACRKPGDTYYRILHNVLEYFYRYVRSEAGNEDVRIVIDKDFMSISQAYCVVGCYLETRDGASDRHFGEMKVQTLSSSAERQSPFNIAVNRAQDKVILKELFGLYTRIYDENGKPVVYQAQDSDDVEMENGGLEDTNVNTSNSGSKGLNSVEEKEFEELGKRIGRFKNRDGKVQEISIAKMSETLLKYITDVASYPEGSENAILKQNVLRYCELREKARGAA